MTDEQLNDVWTEITRTARDGARVIFRTAAEKASSKAVWLRRSATNGITSRRSRLN